MKPPPRRLYYGKAHTGWGGTRKDALRLNQKARRGPKSETHFRGDNATPDPRWPPDFSPDQSNRLVRLDRQPKAVVSDE